MRPRSPMAGWLVPLCIVAALFALLVLSGRR